MIAKFLRPTDDPADPAEAAGTTVAAGGPATVFHGTLADWAPRDGDGVAWSRLLGADEPRYAAMRHDGTRARFAAARRLLKHVCAARLGTEPADMEIAYHPGGSPHLVGAGMPHISISHTRDVVAVAVSGTGPVGVDVEHTDRPLLDYGLAPRVCTGLEQADLAAIPARWRNRYLVQLWTVKESFVKALGRGLAVDIRRVGFTLHESPDGHIARPHSEELGEFEFRLTMVAGEYALACAIHCSTHVQQTRRMT